MTSRYQLIILSYLILLLCFQQRESYIRLLNQNYKRKLFSLNVLENHRTNIQIRGEEWARQRGFEPGYGGIWPGDPNALTYDVTIISKKTNESYSLKVPNDRYIFYYFEEMGIDLPVINKARMCRQGCCTICAVKLHEGEVKLDAPLGLLKDMRDQGYALTCCAYPRSNIVCELQDEDFMYIKQWGEGFEGGGVAWGGVLPDDD
jgi:ferredoxin